MGALKSQKIIAVFKKRFAHNAKIKLVDMNIPISNEAPQEFLRDILEESVEEKYYLNKKIEKKITTNPDFKKGLRLIKNE